MRHSSLLLPATACGLLFLAGIAAGQCGAFDATNDCAAPGAAIVSVPLEIYSCAGHQEVLNLGIDQVYFVDSGVTFFLDGSSWGISGGAVGAGTGNQGDWIYVGSAPVAGGYADTLFFVPPGAGAGEQVDVVQTVTYNPGDDYFTLSWALTNNTSLTFADVRLIQGIDTYVNGDDGCDQGEENFLTAPISNSIGTRDLGPPALYQGLSGQPGISDPGIASMQYYTEFYSTVWGQIATGGLPNTVQPAGLDQGIALAYLRNGALGPGETWSTSMLWIFEFPAVLFPLAVDNPCLPCAREGEAYSEFLTASGGTPPYTWSALTPLPLGLALNPATGELSGTLAIAGSYAFTVRVTDSTLPVPVTADMAFPFDGNCEPACMVTLCGDCDGSNGVNILDALMAARHAVGLSSVATAYLGNCNVTGQQLPIPSEIGIRDALEIALSTIGRTSLTCCGAQKLERTLTCGAAYCGRFDFGDVTADLGDYATTHYFSLGAAPAGMSYTIATSGSGNIDLYVAAPGILEGDESLASYPFASTGGTAAELVILDDASVPFLAAAYAGLPVAIAVKAVTPGDYALTIDCVCLPIDITATGTYSGTTAGQGDDTAGSCGGAGASDMVFRYDLAAGGSTLTISTDNPGTLSDTVLYVGMDSCEDPFTELACDNDSGAGATSLITMPGAAAGTYYIFVDSGGAGGAFQLTVSAMMPAGCAGTVEGTIPAAGPFPYNVLGNTTAADNTVAPSCGLGGGVDALYGFTPAAAGTYSFDLCGTALWDTVLEVRQGTCTGAVLGCNDDSCGLQSAVNGLVLAAGTTYFVLVDSYSGATGAYDLTVNLAGGPACSAAASMAVGACTIEGTAAAVPACFTGNTTGASNNYTPSCSAGGADHVYRFTAPATGTYTFTMCNAPGYDSTLSLWNGDCVTGTELACNDDSCGVRSQQGGVALTIGQVVFVVIDGFGGATGPYQLNITSP